MRARLSPDEIATLQEIAEGHPQEQVARTLNTNIHTTKSRMVAINHKLGTNGAVHAVAIGHVDGYLPTPTDGEPNPRLSPADIQILALIARGKERRQICAALGLTYHQLKYRIRRMYEISEARNHCHLVHWGFHTRNLIITVKRQPEDSNER